MKKITGSLGLMMILAIFFVLNSCKKNEFDHPEVETVSLSYTAQGKVVFKGKLGKKGDADILDYGFAYSSYPSVSENQQVKISLGKGAVEGSFSIESPVYLNSPYERTLFARAYITNSQGTVYGKIINIELPSSSVGNIVPSTGKTGDQVTIHGQFYVSDASQLKVSFGGVNAKIISFSPAEIKVEVPSGINTSYNSSNISVQVSINGHGLYSNYIFKLAPTFTSFSPKNAGIGSSIKIYGTNFSSSYYSNDVKVYFGDVLANTYINNSTEMTVYIPSNLLAEKSKVTVEYNNVKYTLDEEFTLDLPTITGLSQTTVSPGMSVDLLGANIPSNYSGTNHKVSIGGSFATVNGSYYSDKISFSVPGDIAEGEYEVKYHWGTRTVTCPTKLKVIYPKISSFSPKSGSPGTSVVLQGTFLPYTYYTVHFGSGSTDASTNSSSENLTVTVPSAVNAGKVKVSISWNGKSIYANEEFTMVGPSITSFSPTSGVAGEVVTIRGAGFGTYSWGNTVRFGTINANIISATATEIKVTVPSNLNPGAMKLTVITNGQTVISEGNFTAKN